MTRSKSVSARRHRKVLDQVKGFKHSARRRVKAAKEALLHKYAYAYVGRKKKKRDLRSLWIVRLNAAARQNEISYSKLLSGLKKANVEIDRKILSEIAAKDEKTFSQIAEIAKSSFKN